MSSAQLFAGSIKIEGFTKKGKPLFNETCDVYGVTIGALMDSLVESSVLLANNAFSWAVMNEPSSYVPTKDTWKVEASFPEIIGTSVDNSFESKITCHGTIINFESIVKYAVKVRTDQITQAAFNLILAKVGESSLITDELRYSIATLPSGPVQSFHQLAQSGLTGIDLDRILEIAELEGRITEHTAQNALMNGFPQREFLPRNRFQENIFI